MKKIWKQGEKEKGIPEGRDSRNREVGARTGVMCWYPREKFSLLSTESYAGWRRDQKYSSSDVPELAHTSF